MIYFFVFDRSQMTEIIKLYNFLTNYQVVFKISIFQYVFQFRPKFPKAP